MQFFHLFRNGTSHKKRHQKREVEIHTTEDAIWSTVEIPEHNPDIMTSKEYEVLQESPVGLQLEQMFITGAAIIGATQISREWSQKTPYPFPLLERSELLVYVASFFITGMLVYRLPRLTMAEIPVDLDLASFIVAGLLGLALEVAIGWMLFARFALKSYYASKLRALESCTSEELNHYPLRRDFFFAQVRVVKSVINDILETRFGVLDWLVFGLIIVGLVSEVAAAARSLETYDSLNYFTVGGAFLPVIIVVLFALFFGYVLYLPKGKNHVAELFSAKLSTYNLHDIVCRIDLNNALYDQFLCNPVMTHQDIAEMKLQHGVETERKRSDRMREAGLARKAWVGNQSGRTLEERLGDREEIDRIEAQTRIRSASAKRSVEQLSDQLKRMRSPNIENGRVPEQDEGDAASPDAGVK